MERSDIFLSYRRADVEFTKELYEKLKAAERSIWVDWENIPPGVEGFTDEIQRGIEGANAFIPILSPSYLASEYCLMELREALKLKKRVIPVVLEKFDPAPPPEGIGHINWVYFTPHAGQRNAFEDSFMKVIQALEADYEHVREHTRLLLRAIDWQKNEKEKSYLLKDVEIGKAERWQVAASAKNPPPTELHGEYILASRANQRRQQRRLTSLFAILTAIAVVAAIVAVFQWGFAVEQKNNALAQEAIAKKERAAALAAQQAEEIARKEAENQRERALIGEQNALISSLAAQSQLIQSRQLGILVALESYNESKAKEEISPAVQTSLRSALVDFSGLPVHYHQAEGNYVKFSPDDRWLISASQDGNLQVSDLSKEDSQPDILAKEGVWNIAVSPDSQWVAAIASNEETGSEEIHLWDLNDPQADPQILESPDEWAITSLAFVANRNKQAWLVAGMENGNLFRWDVSDLPEAEAEQFHSDKSARNVSNITYSPDGTWMAVAFDYPIDSGQVANPILLVWNLNNPLNDPLPLDLFQSAIMRLTFSKSGKWLAGASDDEARLRVWNMSTASPQANVFDIEGANDIAFSPDERWVAVAEDAQAQVWSLTSFNGIVLPGYKDIVLTAGFSPDSRWLATGDWDGQIRLWNTDDFANAPMLESQARTYHGFDVIVNSLEYNSDGSKLAAAGDQQVRMWNSPISISAPIKTASIWGYQALENGLLVRTSSNSLFTMDLNEAEPVAIMQTEQKDDISYLISPDERYLAVYSGKQIQVWDLQHEENRLLFEDERVDGFYVSPTFTANSRWLVYAVYDRIFALDLQAPDDPIELTDNRRGAMIYYFEINDRWLISVSSSEILAWDTEASDLEEPVNLSGSATSILYSLDVDSPLIFIQDAGNLNVWKADDFSAGPVTVRGSLLGEFWITVGDRWLLTDTVDNGSRRGSISDVASSAADFIGYEMSPSRVFQFYFDEEDTLQVLDLKNPEAEPITLGTLQEGNFLVSPQERWLAISSVEGDSVSLYDLEDELQAYELTGYVPSIFSPEDHWLTTTLSPVEETTMTYLYDLTDDLKMYEISDHMPEVFSADGRWLTLWTYEAMNGLYDLQTHELTSMKYPSNNGFSSSPDGRWMFAELTGNNSTNALLVDWQNPEKYHYLTGHTDLLIGEYFTPDQRLLLTYGYDGTVRVWDLEHPDQDPVVLQHDASVQNVTLSENGKWLISETSKDVYVWQMDFEEVKALACKLVGRNLTQAEWEKYIESREYDRTCENWPLAMSTQ